jgi:hypothetical protein
MTAVGIIMDIPKARRSQTARNGDISLTAIFIDANEAPQKKTQSKTSTAALWALIFAGATIDLKLIFCPDCLPNSCNRHIERDYSIYAAFRKMI